MSEPGRLDAAGVDLNLLQPLFTLLTERGISRAARACGMSQPAMSRALDRLRTILRDELLIRANGGYVLTPRAEQLRIELRELLPRIDRVIRGDEFNPLQSRERFRVITPEYGALMVVADIVARLRSEAPHACVEIEPWHDDALNLVAGGHCDLAIAPLDLAIAPRDGARDLEVSALLDDEFACIVDEHHPLRDPCDVDAYLSYPHIVIAIAEGQQPWIDRPLRGLGRARSVAFRTSWASTAIVALRGTDLIFTATWRWWRRFHPVGLRAVTAPPEFDRWQFGMAWHRRLSAHPAHVWFRSIVGAVTKSGSNGN